jgi:hypothetical protein
VDFKLVLPDFFTLLSASTTSGGGQLAVETQNLIRKWATTAGACRHMVLRPDPYKANGLGVLNGPSHTGSGLIWPKLLLSEAERLLLAEGGKGLRRRRRRHGGATPPRCGISCDPIGARPPRHRPLWLHCWSWKPRHHPRRSGLSFPHPDPLCSASLCANPSSVDAMPRCLPAVVG